METHQLTVQTNFELLRLAHAGLWEYLMLVDGRWPDRPEVGELKRSMAVPLEAATLGEEVVGGRSALSHLGTRVLAERFSRDGHALTDPAEVWPRRNWEPAYTFALQHAMASFGHLAILLATDPRKVLGCWGAKYDGLPAGGSERFLLTGWHDGSPAARARYDTAPLLFIEVPRKLGAQHADIKAVAEAQGLRGYWVVREVDGLFYRHRAGAIFTSIEEHVQAQPVELRLQAAMAS